MPKNLCLPCLFFIINTLQRRIDESGNTIFQYYQSDFSMAESLKEFSKAQLALRNGQDREEIWVAYQNIIYDVSESRLWHKGKHYEHWAGQDLTDELPDAPHTDKVFKRFTVVGKLKVTA